MHRRELVIVACLVLGSADLADAWLHDPYVRVGAPLAMAWALAVWAARAPHAAHVAVWRGAAVTLAALARVLDVHALAHVALAAWLCAPVPARWPFLIAAAGWCPVSGQLAAPLPPLVTNLARVALFAAGLFLASRKGGHHGAPS